MYINSNQIPLFILLGHQHKPVLWFAYDTIYWHECYVIKFSAILSEYLFFLSIHIQYPGPNQHFHSGFCLFLCKYNWFNFRKISVFASILSFKCKKKMVLQINYITKKAAQFNINFLVVLFQSLYYTKFEGRGLKEK